MSSGMECRREEMLNPKEEYKKIAKVWSKSCGSEKGSYGLTAQRKRVMLAHSFEIIYKLINIQVLGEINALSWCHGMIALLSTLS